MTLASNPAVNYADLKAELQTNPAGLKDGAGTTLSQHAVAGNFQECANLLNAVGAGTLPTGILPLTAFESRIVAAEELALTAAQRADKKIYLDEYQALYGGIPLNDPGTWSIVTSFYPSTAPVQPGYTQNTYTQLLALKTRNCSRAETRFGPGVVLMWQDVAQAFLWT